jgi:hypothetical protein
MTSGTEGLITITMQKSNRVGDEITIVADYRYRKSGDTLTLWCALAAFLMVVADDIKKIRYVGAASGLMQFLQDIIRMQLKHGMNVCPTPPKQ